MLPVGVLPSASEVTRKRRLNSDYGLSFLLPMNIADYTEKITLKGHVRDEKGQYYFIDSRSRVRDGLKLMAQIDCQHVMLRLADFKMPYESYIEEGFGVNILSLANLITNATGGKFLFVIDNTFELQDIKDFGRGNALQALQFIIKKYSCEMIPNNFVIHLKQQVGADTGMQYRFKKNIISNSFKDDARTLVTRMYSQMKDGLSFIGLTASNLTAEEYALLNAIPGAIVGGVIKVNYLISPYASHWANSTNAYYDGEIINQDIEDPLELLEATRKALKEQEVPIIDVTIDAADLHKIDGTEPQPDMGDTVMCIDPDMEMNMISARVIELTEYPYEMDKHTSVSLANFMLRDEMDIIADLDKSKRVVDNLLSGAKIRTTVFEDFAKLAIYDINNSKTEVKYDERGIVLQDKTNAQNQVVLSSNGLYLTTNGGASARAAITANGIVAEVIVGILGDFVKLRANQIVVGDAGETIGDGLLSSGASWNQKTTLLLSTGIYTGTLTTNQLIAGSAKISSALIDSIKANQIDVTGGKIIASQIDATNLQVVAANVTGKLVASQIDAKDLHVSSANIDGTITADTVKSTWVYAGTLTAQQINAVNGIVLGANASINWASVTAPSYTQINGTKPPSNADNTTDSIGASRLTKITSTGVYTGTVDAYQVNTVGLAAEKIYQAGSPSNYAVIGGSYGNLSLNYFGGEFFRIDNDISGVDLMWQSGISFLRVTSSNPYPGRAAKPKGVWDFTDATVYAGSIPINAIYNLQTQLNALITRLEYLENNAFILSYRNGGNIVFNSKNIAGKDSTSVLD
ncbi:phage tail protein [Paenibacillus sp. WQ 127069]|uniref:Phage tail protein n=2 Tax=Paenibacillus baimaensis TaxID=2982185 RepID=A0ABT2UTJ3_9BACL|nr:phage tail protein [Paenibacillus sp. WQ 127069]